MTSKELDSAVEVMLAIAKMARKPFVTRRAMGMIQEFKNQNASAKPQPKAKKKTE